MVLAYDTVGCPSGVGSLVLGSADLVSSDAMLSFGCGLLVIPLDAQTTRKRNANIEPPTTLRFRRRPYAETRIAFPDNGFAARNKVLSAN